MWTRAVAIALAVTFGAGPAFASGGDRAQELVAYGHSWPSGHGVADSYAEIAASRLDLAVVNRARPGALSAATAEAVMSRPPHRGDVVVVQTGLNDAIFYGRAGLDVYREQLSKTLYAALARRATVILVVDPRPAGWPARRFDIAGRPGVVPSYRQAAEEVAYGYTALRVVRARVPSGGWQKDGLHPNERGHRAIARQVVAAVRHVAGPR